MIKLLFYKWFGLQDEPCESCELLKIQLAKCEELRNELLTRLLDKDKPIPPPAMTEEEFKPITSQFVPWRIRQQMMEAEDRKSAQLLQQSAKDIAELEKDLGITPIEGVK
jgi:hypothetical protein